MNTPSIPLAVSMVFLVGAESVSTGWVAVASQYGPLGLMTLALCFFTFWQEKQRNRRDDAARVEREKQLASLIAELHQRNEVIDKQMEWMRDKIG